MSLCKVKIGNYLRDYQDKKGMCKKCNQTVQWRNDRLANHKRKVCHDVDYEREAKEALLAPSQDFEISGDDMMMKDSLGKDIIECLAADFLFNTCSECSATGHQTFVQKISLPL